MIFIKVNVKSYIKNITENNTISYSVKGIKTIDKLSFFTDKTKNILQYKNDSLILIRDNNEFTNTFIFNKKECFCKYYLKEKNISFDIDIKLLLLSLSKKEIKVRYKVIDSNCEYEYKVLIGDINEY